MTYGCNEATACVASCAMGAQTAGSTCTTAGETCTYANATGTAMTCTCGGERHSSLDLPVVPSSGRVTGLFNVAKRNVGLVVRSRNKTSSL